jgi:methylglutaconyl-CoA hydratase
MIQPYETIRLEIDPRGTARLVFNRPERHNAFNTAMIREIADAAKRLSEDPEVRAVVMSASGTSFCAGGDLTWMQAQFEADRAARIDEATRLASMLRMLDEMPKLLIAVIEGPAYGGGVGLASVSDIVLAVPDAKFALSETRLGLIPATIAPFVVRRIGLANARRFVLNSNPFSAEEARSMGLVSEIHEPKDLTGALEKQFNLILACAPGAVADAKSLFRRAATDALSEAQTVEALADRWETSEARQGVEAFFVNTRPPWAR